MSKTAHPNDGLFDLLEECCSPEQVAHAWELLAPYYRIVERGEDYPLKPEERLNKRKIASAIRKAMRESRLPEEVAFISLGAWPFRSPIFIGNKLQDALPESFEGPPFCYTWSSHRPTLRSRLMAILGDRLMAIIGDSLGDKYGNRVWTRIWLNLWSSLFHYLAFLTAGKEEDARLLETMVQVQTGCLIVTFQGDSPYEHVWAVICA